MISLSMLVLLSAEAIVKPPMRSMIVGENMTEKMYLMFVSKGWTGSSPRTYFVASGAESLASLERMTRKTTTRNGIGGKLLCRILSLHHCSRRGE